LLLGMPAEQSYLQLLQTLATQTNSLVLPPCARGWWRSDRLFEIAKKVHGLGASTWWNVLMKREPKSRLDAARGLSHSVMDSYLR